MSRAAPSPCKELWKWLLPKLGRNVLGALTGPDTHALSMFVHGLQLWAAVGDAAIPALVGAVSCMQPSTRWIAKEAVPFALDWSHQETLWPRITDAIDQMRGSGFLVTT